MRRHVVDIEGGVKLSGVVIEDTTTKSQRPLTVQGLFIAIGHRHNTDVLRDQLELIENGYLVTEPNSSKTQIAGIFACGDVQDDYYRQAITAAGSGCMAAIDAERWIEEHSA